MPRGLLWIFLDGVGWGEADPERNPLARQRLPTLEGLAGGRLAGRSPDIPPRYFPLDARLGVEGLPASGTGQTSLLTGVNAAAWVGEHRGPYPGAALHPLLRQRSLFRAATQAGLSAAFANAFPTRYLRRIQAEGGRQGAFTRAALQAGIPLRGAEDLRQGRAVSARLSHGSWPLEDDEAPVGARDAREAGRCLARLAAEQDLTVFEYWLTDWAGHHPARHHPEQVLAELDGFLEGVMEDWPAGRPLVLASDHGNLEDLSSRRHSLNPALCIWWGPPAARPLRDLSDLAPALLAALGVPEAPEVEPPGEARP